MKRHRHDPRAVAVHKQLHAACTSVETAPYNADELQALAAAQQRRAGIRNALPLHPDDLQYYGALAVIARAKRDDAFNVKANEQKNGGLRWRKRFGKKGKRRVARIEQRMRAPRPTFDFGVAAPSSSRPKFDFNGD